MLSSTFVSEPVHNVCISNCTKCSETCFTGLFVHCLDTLLLGAVASPDTYTQKELVGLSKEFASIMSYLLDDPQDHIQILLLESEAEVL